MLTAKNLARTKATLPSTGDFEAMGPYDHARQRRWVGKDAMLIAWSMKSDTGFDGESKDPD